MTQGHAIAKWSGRFIGALKKAPLAVAVAVAALALVLCALWRSGEIRALAGDTKRAEAEWLAARADMPSELKNDRDFSAAFEVPISLNDLTAEAGKVAERHGVALVSVDVKRRETLATLDLVGARFSLTMTGAYAALKATLAELWLTRGNWQITNLSMRQMPGVDKVELQLQVAVFMK